MIWCEGHGARDLCAGFVLSDEVDDDPQHAYRILRSSGVPIAKPRSGVSRTLRISIVCGSSLPEVLSLRGTGQTGNLLLRPQRAGL
jgi:hypothetical protein